jgi:hypothetical protein
MAIFSADVLSLPLKDPDETLESALRFAKPGGRIVYVTCSVLRRERGSDRRVHAPPRRSLADRRRDTGVIRGPAGAR